MKAYEAVKRYIDGHGIKQTYVAEKSGIKAKTLNAMLNGHRTMYADDLSAICIALGISVDSIVRECHG